MQIPKIGGTRGIFEIFVPGVFLFINVISIFLISSYTYSGHFQILKGEIGLFSDSLFVIVTFISFGYLFGVILRLMPPDFPDRWSGKLFFVKSEFPYLTYLWTVAKNNLPDDVSDFYNQHFLGREEFFGNNNFFNYCKLMIYSEDEVLGREIYLAESLTRYLSGIFQALLISLLLLFIPIFIWLFKFPKDTSPNWDLFLILIGIFILYSYLIIRILKSYRKIRFKEVLTVFMATYKLKDRINLEKTFRK